MLYRALLQNVFGLNEGNKPFPPSLTVPHRPSPFPIVLQVTVENGEGRECHDDGLWVRPAKIGNGTVMGQNHNYYSILSKKSCLFLP